jgi:hypothetical protein
MFSTLLFLNIKTPNFLFRVASVPPIWLTSVSLAQIPPTLRHVDGLIYKKHVTVDVRCHPQSDTARRVPTFKQMTSESFLKTAEARCIAWRLVSYVGYKDFQILVLLSRMTQKNSPNRRHFVSQTNEKVNKGKQNYVANCRSRDSPVWIVTRLEAGWPRNRGSGPVAYIFSFLSIQWLVGALSPQVKRPGREDDHSLPSNIEVKNTWNYSSTPLYVSMAWCLIKHMDTLR